LYKSIQGESTRAGKPCVFVRLSGCPLRCRWCDSTYTFTGGKIYTLEAIVEEVRELGCGLVEITGGEPLSQPETPRLCQLLIEEGFTVMIETSGALSIAALPQKTHIIMDLKCPGSGMESYNLYDNVELLKPSDEVKFVMASRQDFEWMQDIVSQYGLERRCCVLLSPAFGLLKPQLLVEWMLESGIDGRLNLQIHKFIWHPNKKDV